MTDLIEAYESGLLATAIAIGRERLDSDPADHTAKHFLAMALRDCARYTEAEELFGDLLEIADTPGKELSTRFQRTQTCSDDSSSTGLIASAPSSSSSLSLGGCRSRTSMTSPTRIGLRNRSKVCMGEPSDEPRISLRIVN